MAVLDASWRRSIATVLAATLVLATPFLTLAQPARAGHLDLDTVHTETVDGSGAFGVAIETTEEGAVGATVRGAGPASSTPLSSGVVVFDEEGNWQAQIVVVAHRSPDRTIVSPTPAEPEPASGPHDPGSWVVRAEGDTSVLADVSVTFTLDTAEEPGEGPVTEEEAIVTAGVTEMGTEPGTHYYGIWVGETDRSTLTLRTDAPVSDARTNPGQAHVAGDPDLEDAAANVQVQRTPADPSLLVSGLQIPLGFKVVQDASRTVEVAQEAWGVWGHVDDKEVCTPGVGLRVCPDAELAFDACRLVVGLDCGTARLSWTGPAGGGDLEPRYNFPGTPPGSYTFTVDHKVDVYGPTYGHGSGAEAELTEHWSYLSVGDLSLPE
jgi:hypothetical protein